MKPARPETKASADAWLQRVGVDHLPHDHADRTKALADWGRWFMRQPRDKGMAPNDPNRGPKPKGWA